MTLIGNIIVENGADMSIANKPALVGWSSIESRVVETVSYAQLAFFVKKVCINLGHLGLKPGDPIAILSHPTLDYFITAAGVLTFGGVVVNINWRQPGETMQYMASLGRAVRVLSSAHFVETGDAGSLLSHDCGSIIVIDRIQQHDFDRINSITLGRRWNLSRLFLDNNDEVNELSLKTYQTEGDKIGVLGNGVAAVMFTSGSTGRPKAVPLTHRGLLWSCEAKLKAHGGREFVSKGTLSFLPNFHVMGFTNNFIFNVCVAKCPAFVHIDCQSVPLSYGVLMEACERLRPALLDTIPHMLETLALADDTDGYINALVDCERVLYGGCSLSQHAIELLSARHVKLSSQYGQTELGGMVLLGEPGFGAEMRLVGDLDYRLTTEAELVLLNCPAASMAYLPPLDGSSGLDCGADTGLPKAEHCTNDLFELRQQNSETWFAHKCRTDDLIVHSSGEMTNPLPLEDMLNSELPGCRACVVGQRRPYPVLLLESPKDSLSLTEKLPQALILVNASAPLASKLLRDRVISLSSGVLPRSAKGNVMRHKAEQLFAGEMDRMDRSLVGQLVDVSDSDNGKDDVDEEVPDSLSATKKRNDQQSERDAAIAHVLAICMFSVLQSHSLWPRVTFWQTLGCGWLEQDAMLTNLHTGFELLCMPGFVALASMGDLQLLTRCKPRHRGPKVLLSNAMKCFVAFAILYFASDVVAALYLEGGTNCSGTSMQKVLWFLVFIGTCRVVRVVLVTVDAGLFFPALGAIGLHLFFWGRLPLSHPWDAVNYLLMDCKMSNYAVFYFVLGPLVQCCGIPCGSTRLGNLSSSPLPMFSRKQLKCLGLAMVVLVSVPYCAPHWFANGFQFLSENDKESTVIGSGSTWSSLSNHLAQLFICSFLLVMTLEAVPRKPTMFSRLGNGTFSCYILHWWLRPIWLKGLTIFLASLAPLLGTCTKLSSDAGATFSFGGVVLSIFYMIFLLLVQYSISGISVNFGDEVAMKSVSRFELRYPLRWHTVRTFAYMKLGDLALMVRSKFSPFMFSVCKLIAHALVWWLLALWLVDINSDHPVYLGAKCTAAVLHSNLVEFGASSHLPRSELPILSSTEGGGMCMLMNGGSALNWKPSLCDSRQTLTGEALVTCLNRDYACAHNYTFIHASSPKLSLLRGALYPDIKSKALQQACSEAGAILHHTSKDLPLAGTQHGHLRGESWCRVLLMERVFELFADSCKAVIYLDGDVMLMDEKPFHEQHDIQHFLSNSRRESILLSKRPQPPITPSSSFIVALNQKQTQKIFRRWWSAVDNSNLATMSSNFSKPLRHFRNSGMREESVLSQYIVKKYRARIAYVNTTSHYGGYGAKYARKIRGGWVKEYRRPPCGHRPRIEPVNTSLKISQPQIRQDLHPPSAPLAPPAPPLPSRLPPHTSPLARPPQLIGASDKPMKSAMPKCVEQIHPVHGEVCSQCMAKKLKGGTCKKCSSVLGFNCSCVCPFFQPRPLVQTNPNPQLSSIAEPGSRMKSTHPVVRFGGTTRSSFG